MAAPALGGILAADEVIDHSSSSSMGKPFSKNIDHLVPRVAAICSVSGGTSRQPVLFHAVQAFLKAASRQPLVRVHSNDAGRVLQFMGSNADGMHPRALPMETRHVLAQIRPCLEAVSGSRLTGIVLQGSEARGDAQPDRCSGIVVTDPSSRGVTTADDERNPLRRVQPTI